jgi:glycosyltransferase involved in cell wall biosynthesis
MNKVMLIGTKMNHGGAQIELLEIAKALELRNINFKLVAGTGSLKLNDYISHNNLCLIDMSRPIKLSELVGYFRMVFFEIRNNRPEYIFCSGPLACYFGLFVGKLFGIKKRVYRVSGCTITSANSLITNYRNFFLEKMTFLFSTHSYFVSVFNMYKYKKMGLSSKYNSSIPTIIEFPKKFNNENSISKIRFGYLGNLQKEKGIKVVLDLFKDIDSSLFDLNIAGDGNLKEEVEKICDENISFKYHGIVEPYNFLNSIDVLLMPTLYMEGLPQVISQSIVSSCVIIAYHHEGIPEEVIDTFNGLLVAKNPLSFKEAVEKLIAKPSLLEEMKNNTILLEDFIRKKHSGELLIEQILKDIKR